MLDETQFGNILHEVERRRLLSNPRRVESVHRRTSFALEGEVIVENNTVTIQIVLDLTFPLQLPQFFLRPWNALGFIPHVDTKGLICYIEPEGLILDRYQPIEIVAEAFQRTLNILSDGVTGRNQVDFVDEFETYWSLLRDIQPVLSMLEPSDVVRRVTIAIDQKKDLLYVANDEAELAAYFNQKTLNGTFTIEKGLYLPLEPNTLIIPPRPDGAFWNAQQIHQIILPHLSDANHRILRQLTKRRRSGKYVIVSLPRPSNGVSLFGFQYEGLNRTHPLIQGNPKIKASPVTLKRLERSYLVSRGGGSTHLSSKQILLVGCGAVGGHIAFELARSGIAYLTLVDFDDLKFENIFRHVLGRRYIGKPKADALKDELELQLPYVFAKSYNSSVEDVMFNGLIDLSKYQLIMIAMGNPTVELEINKYLHRIPASPPTIYTWLEPLGIGGHALLTRNSPNGGCFECLYTSHDGIRILENRAAFAAPDQHFGRSLTGCVGFHTPYGSLDAVRTANIAAGLAIDVLTGKEQGNPLISWKNDATIFLDMGFSLAPRHMMSETNLHKQRYTYRNIHCNICGNHIES